MEPGEVNVARGKKWVFVWSPDRRHVVSRFTPEAWERFLKAVRDGQDFNWYP